LIYVKEGEERWVTIVEIGVWIASTGESGFMNESILGGAVSTRETLLTQHIFEGTSITVGRAGLEI
jgi:hypothetical protein